MKHLDRMDIYLNRGEPIRLRMVGGTVWISLPKDCVCIVECRGAGIPGIIGPNVLCDMQVIAQDLVKKAKGPTII